MGHFQIPDRSYALDDTDLLVLMNRRHPKPWSHRQEDFVRKGIRRRSLILSNINFDQFNPMYFQSSDSFPVIPRHDSLMSDSLLFGSPTQYLNTTSEARPSAQGVIGMINFHFHAILNFPLASKSLGSSLSLAGKKRLYLIVSFGLYTYRLNIRSYQILDGGNKIQLSRKDMEDPGSQLFFPVKKGQEKFFVTFSIYQASRFGKQCLSRITEFSNKFIEISQNVELEPFWKFNEVSLLPCTDNGDPSKCAKFHQESTDSLAANLDTDELNQSFSTPDPLDEIINGNIFSISSDQEDDDPSIQFNFEPLVKPKKIFIVRRLFQRSSNDTKSIQNEGEFDSGKIAFYSRWIPIQYVLSNFWLEVLNINIRNSSNNINEVELLKYLSLLGVVGISNDTFFGTDETFSVKQFALTCTKYISFYFISNEIKGSKTIFTKRKLIPSSRSTEGESQEAEFNLSVSLTSLKPCLLCEEKMHRKIDLKSIYRKFGQSLGIKSGHKKIEELSHDILEDYVHDSLVFEILVHWWLCLNHHAERKIAMVEKNVQMANKTARYKKPKFLTEQQASRTALKRFLSFVTYGQYRVSSKGSAQILLQDRKTGQLIEEKIPGYIKLTLRLLHQKSPTVTTSMLKALFRRMTISHGRKFELPSSRSLIPKFIKMYNIVLQELEDPNLENYKNFNEFFFRKLKVNARFIIPGDFVIISPADSRALMFESISQSKKIWIKGDNFSIDAIAKGVKETLGIDFSAYFAESFLLINRLAPQDYHRFHCPLPGKLIYTTTINGCYYTVNPMAIRTSLNVFTENVRTLAIFYHELAKFYWMMVFVGANLVGSIQMTVKVGETIKKGAELGYFAFGGSTILSFFPRTSHVVIDSDLANNSKISLETYIQMGERVGFFTRNTSSLDSDLLPNLDSLDPLSLFPNSSRDNQSPLSSSVGSDRSPFSSSVSSCLEDSEEINDQLQSLDFFMSKSTLNERWDRLSQNPFSSSKAPPSQRQSSYHLRSFSHHYEMHPLLFSPNSGPCSKKQEDIMLDFNFGQQSGYWSV